MDDRDRKRLGQYFSGEKVSKLLVELAAPHKKSTVIDPMAGQGDMLVAAVEAGVCPSDAYGIEIDPVAGQTCKERLPSSNISITDAFLRKTYLYSKVTSWDLVITNPPYVRYQSQLIQDVHGISLQDANAIRKNLIEIIRGLTHLTNQEQECLVRIAKSYSGLSDLAVPAWILCASLVSQGGTLAMVVPESWLNREYALAVKFLLLKLFDIEYIVEDASAAWFSDALVKTNLIVAKRVEYRSSLTECRSGVYKNIKLNASVSGNQSLVENLAFKGQKGMSAFSSIVEGADDVCSPGFSIHRCSVDTIFNSMLSNAHFEKFCQRVDEPFFTAHGYTLPDELCSAIHIPSVPTCEMASIQEWGVHIGQGLRTGANKFFYAELIGHDGETETIQVDSLFPNTMVTLKADRVLPVFRYQSDVGSSLVIRTKDISHRLLYIQTPLAADETDLTRHVDSADAIELMSAGRTTRFRDLSAVKPNIRIGNINGYTIQREWYMLPPLMPRHLPDMCISRVNYKQTRCLFNPEKVVIDANFSTLWVDSQDDEVIYALFAMLNSNWISAYLETIATVMGGGALKVEAAHLRQLIVPVITKERKFVLAHLGERLSNASRDEYVTILDDIDSYLIKAMTGRKNASSTLDELKDYLNRKIESRLR